MAMFQRVRELVFYQKTRTSTAEVKPGVWERAELLDRLGPERLAALERADIVHDLPDHP